MALMAYQQILTTDLAYDEAHEGLINVYRRAQQWPELVSMLVARADAAGASPKARELRTEAAELLEQKLSDSARAGELYSNVLSDDPGHARAGDGLARIAERTGDFRPLVTLLNRRSQARPGREKLHPLLNVPPP